MPLAFVGWGIFYTFPFFLKCTTINAIVTGNKAFKKAFAKYFGSCGVNESNAQIVIAPAVQPSIKASMYFLNMSFVFLIFKNQNVSTVHIKVQLS